MYRHNILKFNVFQPKHICYKQNKFPEFQVLKKKKPQKKIQAIQKVFAFILVPLNRKIF